MNGKQKALFNAWVDVYRGLVAFTEHVNLGNSVESAENVVILRKAEAILTKRLYQMDPDAKCWTD